MQETGRRPVALILEPARDLAEQVFHCMTDFKRHLSDPEARLLIVYSQPTQLDSRR